MLLDLLFPRSSLLGTEGEWLTDEERWSLRRLSPTSLTFDDTPLDRVTACGMYHQTFLLRRVIARWKYKRIRGIEEAFRLLLRRTFRIWTFPTTAVLCPVPLHWTRRFSRGFNQAHVLAQIISGQTGLPVQPLLRRTRATGHQAHRSGVERRSALHGVFASTREPPRYVILVDDVCTTGSTLQECSRVLKQAGAKHVEAIVLALG